MHARLRAAASADVEAAVDYNGDTAGPDIAVDFVDDFQAAISHLTRYPFSVSLTGAQRAKVRRERTKHTCLLSDHVHCARC
jgi:plasmid stabilization system protein ParE